MNMSWGFGPGRRGALEGQPAAARGRGIFWAVCGPGGLRVLSSCRGHRCASAAERQAGANVFEAVLWHWILSIAILQSRRPACTRAPLWRRPAAAQQNGCGYFEAAACAIVLYFWASRCSRKPGCKTRCAAIKQLFGAGAQNRHQAWTPAGQIFLTQPAAWFSPECRQIRRLQISQTTTSCSACAAPAAATTPLQSWTQRTLPAPAAPPLRPRRTVGRTAAQPRRCETASLQVQGRICFVSANRKIVICGKPLERQRRDRGAARPLCHRCFSKQSFSGSS